MNSYTHLAQGERYQISALREAGHSIQQIARALGRSTSTISRELRRNAGARGYRPLQAQQAAKERARTSRSHPRLGPADWARVRRLLIQDWSPEQISERCALEGSSRISPEWIYRYVYADKANGGTLYRHLRGRKKYRKRYGSGRDQRGQLRNCRSIHDRPRAAENRSRLGHWEGDTIRGGRAGAVTLVDRKSRYTRIGKVTRRTAEETRDAVARRLLSDGLPVRTLTVDNGREFADHAGISDDLAAEVFFADPYQSCQRGTNENTNGLIRQYLRKGRDLSALTGPEIRKVENKLNHRPRRCLGWRTPHEAMYGERHQLTVALRS